MTNEKETRGPTCLYKSDKAQTFEGNEVAKAMKDGWKDEPAGNEAMKKETKTK